MTEKPAPDKAAAQQIESTQAAFEASASLVHIHVRESPSSDPDLSAQVQAGVPAHGGDGVRTGLDDNIRLDRKARAMLALRPV